MSTDTDIVPFEVAIEESVLEDLRDRLARTRWPEEETCGSWDQAYP